jgi:hypothetical protein
VPLAERRPPQRDAVEQDLAEAAATEIEDDVASARAAESDRDPPDRAVRAREVERQIVADVGDRRGPGAGQDLGDAGPDGGRG